MDVVTKTCLKTLEKKKLEPPEEVFTFFGFSPEEYRNLEKNVLNILKSKNAEPIKKHLINGLCNLLYKNCYGCGFWMNEEGFGTYEGVEARIENLKKKAEVDFNYSFMKLGGTSGYVKLNWPDT